MSDEHEPDSPNWVRSHEHFENEERRRPRRLVGWVLIVASSLILWGLLALIIGYLIR